MAKLTTDYRARILKKLTNLQVFSKFKKEWTIRLEKSFVKAKEWAFAIKELNWNEQSLEIILFKKKLMFKSIQELADNVWQSRQNIRMHIVNWKNYSFIPAWWYDIEKLVNYLISIR